MKPLLLGVGELGVAGEAEGGVKTMALGSCVAVVFHDRAAKLVGMAHVALPDSSVSPERVAERPAYFADSAVPKLLEAMQEKGGSGTGRGLVVKMVGGANVADRNETFAIGKRNVLALKKILWQYGMGAVAEEVGGNISRTVTASALDGTVTIASPGLPISEI